MDEKHFEQAADYTERLTRQGIRAALNQEHGKPLEINGERHCNDCEAIIDPRRIAVLPRCTRCPDCQQDHELRSR